MQRDIFLYFLVYPKSDIRFVIYTDMDDFVFIMKFKTQEKD